MCSHRMYLILDKSLDLKFNTRVETLAVLFLSFASLAGLPNLTSIPQLKELR